MEMEDIPEADELEWLESNALLPEENEEDFEDYFPDQEEEHQLPEPPRKPPSPISDHNKKRPFLETEEVSASLSEGKKSRSEVSRAEIDEEWLHYSSPPPPPPTTIEEADVAEVVVEEEKYLSRYASEIDGDFISVTGPDGDRVYAKMSRVDTDAVSKRLNTREYSHGLIPEPISTLIERMEQEALMKALQASSESPDSLTACQIPVVNECLWVEKYSPNSFTELLSDEQTNREVLIWLKQWDSCVFGSEIRSTTDDVMSSLRRHSSLSQNQKPSDMNFSSKTRNLPMSNKTFRNADQLGEEKSKPKDFHGLFDKKSRGTGPPEQKVLLLCGPPGLGKTTLAHVAANHCGYRVVEINASDDRSASTTEAKILDVVQMNSIMPDAKPKCLIIDEIDGALGEGKGAVEVILKMVTSDRRSEVGRANGAQEEQPGAVSSKKRRKAASLSRPVICICNDLYAPALRPLRQVAKVHIFVQPTINRVVSRLKYICNKEGFRTSSIALTALAEYTECDIRSCLNTLQFLNKKKENLNVLEISAQVVGRKDMSRTAFDVWKEVFQKRKPKRERSINSSSSMSSDFEFLHALVSSRGEYELTMDGIHENMLQLHYHDPMMQKTVKCLNILGVSDHLHQYIMRTQQMSLYAYQPCTAVAIRSLVSQIQRPNIEWPKSFQRYRTTFAEKKNLLRCWHTRISPCLSRHLSVESFVEDSISPLLHILSPPTLRPVALHLQSEREKVVLTQLVDTMVSYSVTYKKTKPDFLPSTLRHEVVEASALSFDPPIDEFIKFKGYSCGYFGFPLAMKQVLLHEVEKQKFLHANSNRPTHSDVGSNTKNGVFTREESERELSSGTETRAVYAEKNKEIAREKSKPRDYESNTFTKLPTPSPNRTVETVEVSDNPKAPGVAKKPYGGSASYFDRFRKLGNKGSQNSSHSLQKQATLERDSRPLLFKFNEGFTNAVKRPVRIHDLLLR